MTSQSEYRRLTLTERMLLAEWTVAWVAEQAPKARDDGHLLVRLAMPSGRGADMTVLREHVRELLSRFRHGQSLKRATEAEMLVFLEQADGPLNAEAMRLMQTIDQHLRDRTALALPNTPLVEALRRAAHKRPVDKALRRLIKEKQTWTEASNGQAA